MSSFVSLFDAQSQPGAIGAAESWFINLLAGTGATSLCVIAIAVLGFLMLTGQLPVRRSALVVLGCFLLLGASGLAAELQALASRSALNDPGGYRRMVIYDAPEPPPLPPAEYNPYARASVRRD